ncbi:uncharacterized protein K452DRAFT_314803 [Aplosporella prunicola CBS 121167]|uniref:Borealin N-terminal domain-containing protein n=1 Tax=Aplosporella prunicola CBS 121167 TaxID=1176127 RepID=A0A6A6BT37_9PEZI|nr:uncharacterized protein K452DRAFT_314803 [Aplosporella prunicola CBS 121167]KAF2146543.1 hypothetical protein K452DRAFT_314803 [Aplosporella prunicola CBS 121167]
MAPRAKKQQPAAPAASKDSPMETPSSKTPERKPSGGNIQITEAQKQALVDNLQLEVTERARKLRAQYGLLAQGLRSRLEMRVNRIPHALRKTNIQDLVSKNSEQPPAPTATNTITPIPVPVFVPKKSQTVAPPKAAASPERTQSRKRSSNEIIDKENAQQELTVPKKRAKTTAKATSKAVRNISRADAPSSVLSPKSNNSRTLPRSPIKEDLTQKSPIKPTAATLNRPISVLKAPTLAAPESPAKPAPAKPAARSKKAAAAAEPAPAPMRETRQRTSLASSQGEEVAAVPAPAPAKKKAPAKKTAAAKGGATKTTKAAAAKKAKETKEAAAETAKPKATRTTRARAKA